MLTNPGFTFSGISGEHQIVPTYKTDLLQWGPFYQDALVCAYDGKLVKVYDNGPGFNYTDNSVAMEFAAIDYNDMDAIIQFCNKYGMPSSSRQFGNFRNDYLFYNDEKENFSKVIPLVEKRERIWVFTIQREIIHMQKCIKLNQAIQDGDYVSILEILLYFCFDLSGLDFEDSERKTETFQFNHHFFRFAEENGYSLQDRIIPCPLSDLIRDFLIDIENSFYETEMYHSLGFSHREKYVQIYFSMWQHFHTWFTKLLDITVVADIDAFGNVALDPPLNLKMLKLSEKEADSLLKTAKGAFSDIFKEKLHRVYPEIVFNKQGIAESTWRIPSLTDAMYLELFFRFTPSSSVRKCENPTCPKYFIRTSSRPSKKYCDDSCAKLMAKRMERERKRLAKQKEAKT